MAESQSLCEPAYKVCNDRENGVGVMSFHPPKQYTKFSVDRVNLSKVLFILLFLTLSKLAKNL